MQNLTKYALNYVNFLWKTEVLTDLDVIGSMMIISLNEQQQQTALNN